jgi:ketosteroid isomerase-like protein
VDIVRGFLEALRRRDELAAIQPLASDVEWYPSSAGVGVDVVHGPDAVREFGEAFFRVWENAEFEIREIIDAEDAVVVRIRWHLWGRASGVETEVEYSAAYMLDSGKITRYREYASRGEALEAVGMRE